MGHAESIRVEMNNGRPINGNRVKFGYDAIEQTKRRKAVFATVNREDSKLMGSKRDELQETAAELARNQSLAGWMIRRHLDYVAWFRFNAHTGDKALDQDLTGLMEEDGKPEAFDVAGRFGREKMFRLAEARRTMDGDTYFLKLSTFRLQGLQADLLKDPPDTGNRAEDSPRWISGIQVDSTGRPLLYGFQRRIGYTGKQHWRKIRARNIIPFGFYDRYASDQTRGISPVVSALAPLADVYENFDFALAKAKIAQLLAVAFFREKSTQIASVDAVMGNDQSVPDEDGDDVGAPREYDVRFGDRPTVFNLDPGDKVDFIESKTPAGEFQNFTKLVIQVALKALDIPYSFFDESHTNFFGSRAAWLHYDRSAMDKRSDQIEMRRKYTEWKLAQWILEGRLRLPRSMPVESLKWEWIPLGMPWFDPSKEITGAVRSVSAGFNTPQRVCRSTGSDFFDNVDQIAEAMEYAREKGVPLSYAVSNTDALAEAIAGAQSEGS